MRSLFILLSVVASVLAAPYSSLTVIGESSNVSKKSNAVPSNYYQRIEDMDSSSPDSSISPAAEKHLPTIRKPQYLEEDSEEDTFDPPPYKNLEPKRYTVIVPSLPNEQADLNEKKATTDRRYKKLMNLIEQVKKQVNMPEGVRQKQVVGTDLNGHLRYIEIPYYNRGSI